MFSEPNNFARLVLDLADHDPVRRLDQQHAILRAHDLHPASAGSLAESRQVVHRDVPRQFLGRLGTASSAPASSPRARSPRSCASARRSAPSGIAMIGSTVDGVVALGELRRDGLAVGRRAGHVQCAVDEHRRVPWRRRVRAGLLGRRRGRTPNASPCRPGRPDWLSAPRWTGRTGRWCPRSSGSRPAPGWAAGGGWFPQLGAAFLLRRLILSLSGNGGRAEQRAQHDQGGRPNGA